MNNNTKDLTRDIQELAASGVEVTSLLNGIIEMSYLISEPKNTNDKKLLDSVRNGLSGITKLLESEVTTKLFNLDDYVSINGEVYKGAANAK